MIYPQRLLLVDRSLRPELVRDVPSELVGRWEGLLILPQPDLNEAKPLFHSFTTPAPVPENLPRAPELIIIDRPPQGVALHMLGTMHDHDIVKQYVPGRHLYLDGARHISAVLIGEFANILFLSLCSRDDLQGAAADEGLVKVYVQVEDAVATCMHGILMPGDRRAITFVLEHHGLIGRHEVRSAQAFANAKHVGAISVSFLDALLFPS